MAIPIAYVSDLRSSSGHQLCLARRGMAGVRRHLALGSQAERGDRQTHTRLRLRWYSPGPGSFVTAAQYIVSSTTVFPHSVVSGQYV